MTFEEREEITHEDDRCGPPVAVDRGAGGRGGGPVAGLLTAVGESPLTEVGSGAGGGLAHRADLLADHGDVLLSFDTFNPFETLSHQ